MPRHMASLSSSLCWPQEMSTTSWVISSLAGVGSGVGAWTVTVWVGAGVSVLVHAVRASAAAARTVVRVGRSLMGCFRGKGTGPARPWGNGIARGRPIRGGSAGAEPSSGAAALLAVGVFPRLTSAGGLSAVAGGLAEGRAAGGSATASGPIGCGLAVGVPLGGELVVVAAEQPGQGAHQLASFQPRRARMSPPAAYSAWQDSTVSGVARIWLG